jgi:hypothetical protein
MKTPRHEFSDTLLPPCHPEALFATPIIGDVWAEGPLRRQALSYKTNAHSYQFSDIPHRLVIPRPSQRLPSSETYGPRDLNVVKLYSIKQTPILTNSVTHSHACHPEALTGTTIVGDVWAEGSLRRQAISYSTGDPLTSSIMRERGVCHIDRA